MADEEAPTRAQAGAPPSTLDREAALAVFKRWFLDDANHSATWRTNAKKWFDFRAGEQWTPEEKSMLKGAMRPEIVFNWTITLIKAVAGFEINGRHEIQYLPRNIADTAVNEVLTGASKWMSDECDAEDEESEAFQDTLTCGMGWTENVLDYEEEADGKYIEGQVDPLEMYWDHAARKKNLTDTRRRWRLRKMPLADAKALCPGGPDDHFEDEDYDARWATGLAPEEETKTLEEKRKREENADNYTERDDVHILHAQWWEREPYHLVADPQSNKKLELSTDEFSILADRAKQLGIPVHSVKMTRRRFKQAFIGGKILELGDLAPQQFTWKCITGEIDKSKGVWFGLIRIMEDPQKWANKWLSQVLHIINSNAKGGIVAEPDAFEDQRQAEETWAKPEAITWAAKGALSGPNGAKWVKKPVAEFPAGIFQLLEFAVQAVRDVPGVNLELLGQKDINQPGILEAQRKQAGMTVLATMFDSLRRFRKQVGSIRLFYIQNFLSDGRLIRVTGPDGAKVIPLIREKTLGEYSVHIDDTPTSPNQKEANWAIIGPFLPIFKEQIAAKPALLVEILKFSPLPSGLVEAIEKVANQPDPTQAQAAQIAQAGAVAKVTKDQAQAELFMSKARSTEATSMYDLAMAQNLLLKHQGDMAAAFNEARQSGADAAKTAAETAHISAKTDTERANADRVRAQTVGDLADAHHTSVQAGVAALTPIPHSDGVTGGPAMPPPTPDIQPPPAV